MFLFPDIQIKDPYKFLNETHILQNIAAEVEKGNLNNFDYISWMYQNFIQHEWKIKKTSALGDPLKEYTTMAILSWKTNNLCSCIYFLVAPSVYINSTSSISCKNLYKQSVREKQCIENCCSFCSHFPFFSSFFFVVVHSFTYFVLIYLLLYHYFILL